jgi:hypothetical protein
MTSRSLSNPQGGLRRGRTLIVWHSDKIGRGPVCGVRESANSAAMRDNEGLEIRHNGLAPHVPG